MLPKVSVIVLVAVCVLSFHGCMALHMEYPGYCDVLFDNRRPPTLEWMEKYDLEDQLKISGCGLVHSHPRDYQPVYVMIDSIDIEAVELSSILEKTAEVTVVYAVAYVVSYKVEHGDSRFKLPLLLSTLHDAIENIKSPFLRNEVKEFTSSVW